MLKFDTVKWPPAPDEVTFSPRSVAILMREGDDSHHDRVTELGSRCGDLLIVNMDPPLVDAITGKLAGGLDEGRRGAFLQGVKNAMDLHSEQRAAGAISGGEL